MRNLGIETSMLVDYFTRDGLIKKTGVSEELWNYVILKELIDNALDAIEPLKEKHIQVNLNDNDLQIFDNGEGIPPESLCNSIYDFTKYYSSNRHYITPSRGKQGNGLKTIISICYLRNYRILWHTSAGIIENIIDASEAADGEINVETVNLGETEYRGVEILGYHYFPIEKCVRRYVVCNPDVNFRLIYNEKEILNIIPTAAVIDKSKNTSISFYDIKTYRRLIRSVPDGNITYKKFLNENFGTRIANNSSVKSKIKDIDLESSAFIEDFMNLKSVQQTKQFTILKKQMIGLPYCICVEDTKQHLPCIVEYDIQKIEDKCDKKYWTSCTCYANNTITYHDSWSFVFEESFYDLGMRKCRNSKNLAGLLEAYSDFRFIFHFICPQFVFSDAGKTEMDISGIMNELVSSLRKSLQKEKKKYDADKPKKTINRDLMRKYVQDAFDIASSNGKYAITARQIYYKMRELSGIVEGSSTYSDFTQNILTEWLSENPDKEEKVNFSERGNYYIGHEQNGLGTGSVRALIGSDGSKPNKFVCYGGINEDAYIDPDFDLEYEYDKVLYIEKTGFDAIFKAEKIGEKYNMIIVSGQGYGTRAAKRLLYFCQQKGMKIFCMHDLDIAGVRILDSLRMPNDKFPYSINAIDLGITIADVNKYGIVPERVEKKENENLSDFSYEYIKFFNKGTYYQRVELNAFTTEQILEIIDTKLKNVSDLPKVDLSKAIEIDEQKMKEIAFMRLLKDKFHEQLNAIPIEYDLSQYEGTLTVYEAKEKIPEIKEEIIQICERAIEENLTFLKGA